MKKTKTINVIVNGDDYPFVVYPLNKIFARKLVKLGKFLQNAKFKQTTGDLVEPIDNVSYEEKYNKQYVDSYCVIGFLGCKKNFFKRYTWNNILDIGEDEYSPILRKYNFTNSELGTSILENSAYPEDDFSASLSDLLWRLNDGALEISMLPKHDSRTVKLPELSAKRIGKILERIGKLWVN